jgi:microcystin degradation protein MlrC
MTKQSVTSQPVLRLFAGGVLTETNVFSPLPTGLRDFAVARSDDPPEVRSQLQCGTVFVRYANAAAAAGCSYSQGLYAFAVPAGVTTRAAYETLRDSLLEDLRSALPLDGILLTLHGAMVADGYVDCETDLVVRARQLVGKGAKIGVLLDPHCDLPDELVEAADVIIALKEYPHIDGDQRADELARLVIAAASGHVDPTMATFDCRMIGVYSTPPEPMRTFVNRLRSAEKQAGILSVSLGHGFPWGDSPTTGARMLVVSDGDRERAQTLAAELGHEFFALRHDVSLQASAMPVALDQALSVARSSRPVVIADVSDNAGGGATSDSTFVLRELLEREVEDAALALLWDPIAVQQAFGAGEGAELTLRLGGKMGPSSGQPLDLTVRVRGLVQDLVQRWPQAEGFAEVSCGDCVCLTCGGVDVIVSTVRQQVLGLEVFTAFGIDPTERQLLVVKSMNHFRAAFAPIAAEVVYMSAPGALNLDPRAIPYQHVDTRKFPWLDDPWGAQSERSAIA